MGLKPIPLKRSITHGINPKEFKVVVRLVEEKGYVELKGGFKLHKPDDLKERDEHAAVEGEIVAISPLAFNYAEWPDRNDVPKVGDMAIFARFSGNTITGNDGVKYRIMNDKDIMAIREVAR